MVRVVIAAEVAGEDNLRPVSVELNGGCAQDMTGATKESARATREVQTLFEFDRSQLLE